MGAPGIKICGVTRRGDIEAMNRLGVDLVGFNFVEKSPRYVTQDNAAALAAQCRADMERVALLVDPDDDAIDRALAAVSPHRLQLHGHETRRASPRLNAVRMPPSLKPCRLKRR